MKQKVKIIYNHTILCVTCNNLFISAINEHKANVVCKIANKAFGRYMYSKLENTFPVLLLFLG